MAFVLDDVRSWGRSGNYLLFPSISHFDPDVPGGVSAISDAARHCIPGLDSRLDGLVNVKLVNVQAVVL
jgi:hypothetical protein